MGDNLNKIIIKSGEKGKIKKRVKKKQDDKYLFIIGGAILLLFTFVIYGAIGGDDDNKKKFKVRIENSDIRAQINEIEKKRNAILEKERKIKDDVFLGKGVEVADIADDIISGLKKNTPVNSEVGEDSFPDSTNSTSDDYPDLSDKDLFEDFNPEPVNSKKEENKASQYSGEKATGSKSKNSLIKRWNRTIIAFSNRDKNARIFVTGKDIIVNCKPDTDYQGRERPEVNKYEHVNKTEGKGTGKLIYNSNPVKKIFEGEFIEAVLVNKIVNDIFDSPVLCRVVKDFFDNSGIYVLIPANTRIIGKAVRVSPSQGGRLIIRFHRMIFPNNRSIVMEEKNRMSALSPEGIYGLSGSINGHIMKKYGTALFYGLLNGLGGFAQNRIKQSSGTSMMIGRSSENFEQLNDRITAKNLSVVPTITLKSGSPLKIYISADIEISAYSRIDERYYSRKSNN